MIINEYNDTSLPKVVLLHGMGMDGRTMRLVTEGMSREYCLIIPDLTGQGRDTGTYESNLAEAEALTVYLLERGYTDVELLMGVSLGANVGMTMLAFPEVRYRTAVFEGVPMYEGSKFVAPMMKEAFYLLRAHMLRRPKDKLQAGMVKILGNAPDPRVDEAVGAFIDAFRNISKETISNVCDEVGDYPFYPIEPAVQDRVFLEFGSKDMNCGQVPNIKRHYPYVHVKINEGYAHCGYVVANLTTYGAHLEEYMATYSDEGSSPVPSDEAGLAPLSKIRAVVGTNAWGGSLYGKALRGSYVDEDVLGQAARAAVEAGIPILDTAQDYGLGKCQPIVGRVCDGDVLISSKYTPMSKRYKPGQVRASLARDLRAMGRIASTSTGSTCPTPSRKTSPRWRSSTARGGSATSASPTSTGRRSGARKRSWTASASPSTACRTTTACWPGTGRATASSPGAARTASSSGREPCSRKGSSPGRAPRRAPWTSRSRPRRRGSRPCTQPWTRSGMPTKSRPPRSPSRSSSARESCRSADAEGPPRSISSQRRPVPNWRKTRLPSWKP